FSSSNPKACAVLPCDGCKQTAGARAAMVADSPLTPGRRYSWSMPGWVGWPELLVLVVVLLLIFGPKRLPEMGRSVGKGLREFKDSITGKEDREQARVAEIPAPREEGAGFC